jgi:hypothetical protein
MFMSYTKTIVCLANSRKLAGRCVAGKEWDGRHMGDWCRPVSGRDRGELTAERWYSRTWRDPQLLDLIEVSLLGPRPSGFQTENHLVDSSVRWKYAGRVSPHNLLPAIDRPDGPLWANGVSTASGVNDKVPAAVAERQRNSLVLVQPKLLTLTINTEGADAGNPRRRVRGHFSLGGSEYALSVTDPIVEKPFLSKPEGFSTELQNPLLCISLSEKYNAQNACFKLIAGVICVHA